MSNKLVAGYLVTALLICLVGYFGFSMTGAIAEARRTVITVVLLTFFAAVMSGLYISAFISRQITRLEQRVMELTAQLEAANRELEAFSYSVSHDLRAPLRHLDGFSRALREDYADRLDDEGRNLLERVSNAAKRMGRLIDDLLQLSRMSRQEMRREPVDLSRMVEEIADELQMSQPERQVSFRCVPGVTVDGDPHLLQVALANLLGNAWKYTGKGDAVSIELGVMERDGGLVCFVRDNGAGFDMRYADRLFAPFQRLHGADEFEGTGIGLATVQRIIHRHGGQVWAEGEPGKGATFYFTIPGLAKPSRNAPFLDTPPPLC